MKINSMVETIENEILRQTGRVVRVSVEFTLPDYASDSLQQLLQCWLLKEATLHVKKRTDDLVCLRQIASLYLYEKMKISKVAIARYWNQDHTTTLHHLRRAQELRASGDTLFMKYYTPVKHLFDEKV